ncbi:MAG: hypothetical protein BWZ01_02724 [Deltaproteobacteria bacterium ADurb.BinA179]|nr:MAG: hypothetical protein BWZ01_02724 [Deltaproteobacteria bacterium ADurb.BinA179]
MLLQRGENGRVVVERRGCGRGEVHLAEPADVCLAVSVDIDPGVDIGVWQCKHLSDLEKDIGHVVDAVFAVRSDAAEGDRLIGRRCAEESVADIGRKRHVVGDPQVEAADQLHSVPDVGLTLLCCPDFFQIGQIIGLQKLVEPPQREPDIGIFHVHADPCRPYALHSLIQCLRRHAGDALGHVCHMEQLLSAGGVRRFLGLKPCFGSQIACIRLEPLEAVDHALQSGTALIIEGAVVEPVLDMADQAGGAFLEHILQARHCVGDAYGLGADDGDEPLVDPQGQRAVELLVDPLMKRPVQPEGKDIIEHPHGLFAYVIGIEEPFPHGVQLSPDRDGLGVRIYDHPAHRICRRGAGKELCIGDNGLLASHQMLERQALPENRLPRPAGGGFLEAVFPVPVGQQLRALGAQLRSCCAASVQQEFHAREILEIEL